MFVLVRFESCWARDHKVTNETASCAIKSIGYKGYSYSKDGKNVAGTGGGKDFDPPLAPGQDSDAQKFSVGSGFKDGLVGEAVITSVECADGTKWEDDSKAPPNRPMGGVKK